MTRWKTYQTSTSLSHITGRLSLVAVVAVAGCAQPPARVVSGLEDGPRVIKPYNPLEPGPVNVAQAPAQPARPGGLSGIAAPVQTAQVQEVHFADIEPAAGPAKRTTPPQLLTPQETVTPVAEAVPQPEVSYISHKVEATDTLYKLARQYSTTTQQIMADNNLKSFADIRPGQTLAIARNSKPQTSVWADVQRMLTDQPTQTATVAKPQPVQTASLKSDADLAAIEPAAGRAPGETAPEADVKYVMHTVQPKETIYRISLQYNASVLDIMAANEFTEPQDLKADSIIRVPVKTDLPTQLAAKAPEAVKEQAVKMGVVEKQEVAQAELETEAVEQQAAKDAQMASANVKPVTIDMAKIAEQKRGYVDKQAARAKGLVWPVKGKVISKFGDKGNGVALTGINIETPEGTPVLASESGKVLYADNGLKVYGNLVLVQHSNGMVSAYAHNSYLLVKKGERVKKGQVLALSGASGNVEKPQLHFELRRHASAVDPLHILPKL